MKVDRFTSLAILPALIFGACQQSKSATVAPTLAVEFAAPYIEAEPPHHISLLEGGETTSEIPLDLLRPLDAAAPPSTHGTLSLQFTAEAGKVITTVYTIPPEAGPLRSSDGNKRLLGTHSVLLNETVTLDELKNIGYEPFTIRVVQATPPQIAHPALISKVLSIQIAIAEPGGPPHSFNGETPYCSVVLHNKSSLGVMAYVLSEGIDSTSGDRQSQGASSSSGKPVIEPEKDSRPELVAFGHATKMTPQGPVNLPAAPQQVVLEAALFSDGTYEGEHKVAATLIAREIENRAFSRMIAPVIDRIVGDSSIDDDTRVTRIKDEIFRISSKPDEAALHSLEAKFPDVDPAELAIDLTRSRDEAKNHIWSGLYGYMTKCCQLPPPDRISVPEWWQHQRREIETLLNSSR